MRRSISASPRARASSLALALALLAGPAPAQQAGAILVIDMEQVMRDSQAAQALAALERDARDALQLRFDATKEALETRERELLSLRDTLAPAEFEPLARAFDERVRTERRSASTQGQALQRRFAAARQALAAAVRPHLQALMQTRGASIAFEGAAVLAAGPDSNATEALIARLDAALPREQAEALLPAPHADEQKGEN